jgi:Phage major capsid protein E
MNAAAVFNLLASDPAFSMATLTDLVVNSPFAPTRLGDMKLFQARGIPTLVAGIEIKQNTLSLVSSSPRGSANKQDILGKRKMKFIEVPHFAEEASLTADVFGNVRAEGTMALESVGKILAEHAENLTRNLDLTEENLRLGAIRGKLMDSDGVTVIADLFDLFGIVRPSAIVFNLSDPALDIRSLCAQVRRKIIAGGTGSFAPKDAIRCFLGDAAFDKLVNHPTVFASYKDFRDMQWSRTDFTFDEFPFAGIIFENYRGDEAGNGVSIAPNDMVFFPETPSIYRTYYAPADRVDYVNTDGLARYMWQEVSTNRRYVGLEVQMNPLPICLKPAVLIEGTVT